MAIDEYPGVNPDVQTQHTPEPIGRREFLTGVALFGILGGLVTVLGNRFTDPNYPYRPPTLEGVELPKNLEWDNTDIRMAALQHYTNDQQLTYVPGKLIIKPDDMVYVAPDDGTAAQEWVSSDLNGQKSKVENPILIDDDNGDNWFLVDGPFGAAYMPVYKVAYTKDGMEIASDDRYNEAAADSYRMEVVASPVIQNSNRAEVIDGTSIVKFDISGFTLDVIGTSGKKELEKRVQAAHFIDLSRLVEPPQADAKKAAVGTLS